VKVRLKQKRLQVKARTRKKVRVLPEPILPTREVFADDQYYRYVQPEEKFEPGDEYVVTYVAQSEKIPRQWLGFKAKNIPGAVVRRKVDGKPPFPPPKDFAGYVSKKSGNKKK
jgi:hypothetical protein